MRSAGKSTRLGGLDPLRHAPPCLVMNSPCAGSRGRGRRALAGRPERWSLTTTGAKGTPSTTPCSTRWKPNAKLSAASGASETGAEAWNERIPVAQGRTGTGVYTGRLGANATADMGAAGR